jgi:protein-S-isoprenylcysteine O-methyltransferase Ste14
VKGFPDLPPIWWLASVLVIYAAKLAVPNWHFDSKFLSSFSWVIFGLALIIIGWSAIWFFKKKTPIEPHHTPKTLINEGPYRLSRNPIYLALVLLTVASAIGHGSFIGLGSAALLWWVLDRRFAGPEEALLRQSFGRDADEYISLTRRWI